MQRDIAKTLSFGCIHFTVAFGVVYLLTGSFPIAAGVALVEPLVNTAAYFIHERAWNLFGGRKEWTSSGSGRGPMLGQES